MSRIIQLDLIFASKLRSPVNTQRAPGGPLMIGVHCFTVELTGDLYVLRNTANGMVNALAKIELGNPRKHGDEGQPWYCDGLISKAPGLPMTKRRLAAR